MNQKLILRHVLRLAVSSLLIALLIAAGCFPPVGLAETIDAVYPAGSCAALDKEAGRANWRLDKRDRTVNGITGMEIWNSMSGGSVIVLTGYSYGTINKAFDGRKNTTYVYLQNEARERHFYVATASAYASGVQHELRKGRNMELADFICAIDVSALPDGAYLLGTANHFIIDGAHYHHGYTLGDNFTVTIKNGRFVKYSGLSGLAGIMYSEEDKNARRENWRLDEKRRIESDVYDFTICRLDDGHLAMTVCGWSYSPLYGFDGKANTTYITVTDSRGVMRFFKAEPKPGSSGLVHTSNGGKNLDRADFECVIDLEDFADGNYSLGTANYFIIKGAKYHHGYTLGEDYTFSLWNGKVAMFGNR